MPETELALQKRGIALEVAKQQVVLPACWRPVQPWERQPLLLPVRQPHVLAQLLPAWKWLARPDAMPPHSREQQAFPVGLPARALAGQAWVELSVAL